MDCAGSDARLSSMMQSAHRIAWIVVSLLGAGLGACSSSDAPASSTDATADVADTTTPTDATDARPQVCTLDAPSEVPVCDFAFPAQPCTEKCATCRHPADKLWGPCICDGTKWVCMTDTDCGFTAATLPECP